jgi:hypothetical protein
VVAAINKGRDCASAKITTPRPGDGTSKTKTNVDREFTCFPRDSTNTNDRKQLQPRMARANSSAVSVPKSALISLSLRASTTKPFAL